MSKYGSKHTGPLIYLIKLTVNFVNVGETWHKIRGLVLISVSERR